MATVNYSWNLPVVGGSEDTWGTDLNANWTALDTLLGGTNATEFAILDGATVSTAELNLLDGVTWTLTDYNALTATATELNLLDGITALTGSDTEIVTGTAGTDGQFAQWNADGDIVGADIDTLPEADWETGTSTTESLVSPAKVKAAIDEYAIGIGQTWQNVAGSRSSGVSYQNTTGRPIMVHICGNNSTDSALLQVSTNGSSWVTITEFDTDTDQQSGSAIVPNNNYYRLTTGTAKFWAELR